MTKEQRRRKDSGVLKGKRREPFDKGKCVKYPGKRSKTKENIYALWQHRTSSVGILVWQ